jgi:signal transduction histidine kinase
VGGEALVGAILGISLQSKQTAIIDALDTVYVIATDERTELLAQVVELQPEVLILDAYHGSDQELLSVYRKKVPWGYVVLICQQQSDLILASEVDEIWPIAALAMDKVRLLMQLSKFNRYRCSMNANCKLADIEENCHCACHKGLDRFFVDSRRFISPGAWGRKVLEQWDFVLQHIAHVLDLAAILPWSYRFPEEIRTVNVDKPMAASQMHLLEGVASSLVGSNVQLVSLRAGRVWLLSVQFEGVLFPLAAVLGKSQTEQYTEQVADRVYHAASSRVCLSTDTVSHLLSDTLCQAVEVLSREYSVALRSYRQCVFCREFVTDKAYHYAVSTATALGIVLLDAEHNVIFANDLAIKLLTSDDQVAKAVMVTPRIPQEALDKALALGNADTRVKITLPSSGGRRVVVFAARALSEQGEILGYALTMQEDTEVEDLRGEARLRERLAAIGELAAGMAHEIRNPLTSIRGFMQLLKQRLLAVGMGAETLYSDYALEEIDRANTIITDFLTLAKPKEEIWLLIDINELLDKMLQLVENQAVLRGVCLTWQFTTNLPKIKGKADALVQVFLNIIANALQATPKGGSIHITTSQLDDNMLIVSIQDTGNGMSSTVRERIFAPFYSTKEGGTGLGLALCRQIVEEHNGEIQVTSALGEGSCFSVLLPIA